jgi:hypothetical protein
MIWVRLPALGLLAAGCATQISATRPLEPEMVAEMQRETGRVELAEVKSVTWNSGWRGAARGALVGLIAGPLLGFAIGAAAPMKSGCVVSCGGSEDEFLNGLEGLSAGLLLGPISGAIVGAIIGVDNRIDFK